MAWRIELHARARKQLQKMDHADARRIRAYLRDRLMPLEEPRQLGQPLKGQLGDYWRYRVGDYRVICEIREAAMVVLVVRIGHRKEVYR